MVNETEFAETPVSSAADIYDAFAPEYREYSEQKSTYINAVDELIIQRFRGKVSRLLDFGAGDGVRGANLAAQLKAPHLVQADVSQEMVSRCRDLGHAEEVWHLNNDLPDSEARFDLIVSLWNVLGHIPRSDQRIAALSELGKRLSKNGFICFDVNNRHNQGYGRWRVLYRRFVDWLYPNDRRGDAHFEWKIGNNAYPAFGHLFTRAEVLALLDAANLEVVDWQTVDYVTGEYSPKVTHGHLFFLVKLKQ